MRIALCIVAGIVVVQAAPSAMTALARLEIARVYVPVGLLIWVMIIPMVFAFAPFVALLLGMSSIAVPWETLAVSVVLYSRSSSRCWRAPYSCRRCSTRRSPTGSTGAWARSTRRRVLRH